MNKKPLLTLTRRRSKCIFKISSSFSISMMGLLKKMLAYWIFFSYFCHIINQETTILISPNHPTLENEYSGKNYVYTRSMPTSLIEPWVFLILTPIELHKFDIFMLFCDWKNHLVDNNFNINWAYSALINYPASVISHAGGSVKTRYIQRGRMQSTGNSIHIYNMYHYYQRQILHNQRLVKTIQIILCLRYTYKFHY